MRHRVVNPRLGTLALLCATDRIEVVIDLLGGGGGEGEPQNLRSVKDEVTSGRSSV